ncbi:unnamed protein product [Coregonus sp. 'balchen']|nr:unnamed protein product [Coregonus sp. 'balchen']
MAAFSDIQAESIPLILGGGDVLMAAETGSGKTGAFSIPVIQIVYETLKDQQEGKKGRTAVKTGGAVFNKWQMNPYDRSTAFAIGPDGLCCQSREFKEWHGCRSTKAITKGKYYYEVSCRDQGLCTDKYGFGFGGTGKKSHNKQFDSTDLGLAFEIPAHLKNQPFFASCVLKNAELKFNFGGEEFKNAPKTGFVALDQAAEGHVVKSSQTGSAKVSEVKAVSSGPKALIIEPSKELAEQTLNNRPAGCTGARGKLTLSQVRFLVLDECDGLLSAGYTDFIMRVYNQIPQVTSDGKRLQVIVCIDAPPFDRSCTSMGSLRGFCPRDRTSRVVRPLNRPSGNASRQKNPTDEVHAKDNTRPGANSSEMWSEAIKILKGEYTIRAIKEHNMDQAIIFCRTKIDCDNMEQYFILQGGGPDKKGHRFSCVCLHGDRKPNERKTNLDRFKKQEVKFLICTDVAARGIDIHGVPYVINVTLPDEKQNYVHRIGRVGRAERCGTIPVLTGAEDVSTPG